MASVFRRRITNQLIGILKPLLEGEEKKYMYDNIPISIKYCQHKDLLPQFELNWKDVLKLNQQLENRIHPNTIMTYLKNQDFPTSDGIKDVSFDPSKKNKFIFSIEQEIFTSSILRNLCNRINDIPDNSTFFKTIPPETVVIDYSSPNIAKPFHYGHFRSTAIGNFISNLCKYIGHDVTQINYIGDWGMQYGILAVGFKKFGSEQLLETKPLDHLYEVYKKANEEATHDSNFKEEARQYFAKMEQGDPEVIRLWKKLKDLSLREINETYKRLNISFDEIHGESMYAEQAKKVLAILLEKNIALPLEDGSIEAIISKENCESEKTMLQKSDGTTLYLTRDIAAAIDRRKKYHFDSSYYVVDSSQIKHFNNLKQILNLMEYSWSSNIHHIPFGRVSNFSTRKGNVTFLSDILDEAQDRTLEKIKSSPNTKIQENFEAVADILGVSSLIVNDFRTKRKKDFKFDWERALNMNADSGISLQYCHARLNSIKENCGIHLSLDCELTSLVEPEAISLIAHLARFDETIYFSYKELEPCILVHYLFVLRTKVGSAIKVLPVKGTNPYVARARLFLFHASYLVLHKSFQILGITPLDKM